MSLTAGSSRAVIPFDFNVSPLHCPVFAGLFFGDLLTIIATTNSVGGFIGPFDALAQVIIYCFMLIVFIDMSFGLIHKLPDLVMGWIGGTSTDRGEVEMQSKEKEGRAGTKSYGDQFNAISNKKE